MIHLRFMLAHALHLVLHIDFLTSSCVNNKHTRLLIVRILCRAGRFAPYQPQPRRGRDSATLEEPLRPGAPPRQPKPKGKAAEAILARKKLLVLCDLPKRGDNRPGYRMLSTERYQGEMKVMWDKKLRKQKKERERRHVSHGSRAGREG